MSLLVNHKTESGYDVFISNMKLHASSCQLSIIRQIHIRDSQINYDYETEISYFLSIFENNTRNYSSTMVTIDTVVSCVLYIPVSKTSHVYKNGWHHAYQTRHIHWRWHCASIWYCTWHDNVSTLTCLSSVYGRCCRSCCCCCTSSKFSDRRWNVDFCKTVRRFMFLRQKMVNNRVTSFWHLKNG